jgi:nucleotide-binding universal stress UspA family protein
MRENPDVTDPTPAHILVLYEDSRRGAAAIQQAAELATRADALLTVVAVAVTEPEDTHCCDTRSVYWNGVVQELAAEDLGRARALLDAGTASKFKVVTERSVPVALALEARRSRADMIVVPSDRGIYPRSRSRRARQVKRRIPDAVVVAALGSRLPA